MDSVIPAFESRTNRVHTTHSWDFLGVISLYQYDQQGTEARSDVVVGGRGLWGLALHRRAFLGPVPEKFKAQCVQKAHGPHLFDYVSGDVAALKPGLICDFHSDSAINFLCGNGASPAQLKNLTGDLISCGSPPASSYDFNYPSIRVSNVKGSVSTHPTVTYQGQGPSVYTAVINSLPGGRVAVYP